MLVNEGAQEDISQAGEKMRIGKNKIKAQAG
jgi:hypothetical protein